VGQFGPLVEIVCREPIYHSLQRCRGRGANGKNSSSGGFLRKQYYAWFKIARCKSLDAPCLLARTSDMNSGDNLETSASNCTTNLTDNDPSKTSFLPPEPFRKGDFTDIMSPIAKTRGKPSNSGFYFHFRAVLKIPVCLFANKHSLALATAFRLQSPISVAVLPRNSREACHRPRWLGAMWQSGLADPSLVTPEQRSGRIN
jgi:hypothetical protein